MGYLAEVYGSCWRYNYTGDVSVSDIELANLEIEARLDRANMQHVLHDFSAASIVSEGCAAMLVFSTTTTFFALHEVEKLGVVTTDSQFSYLVNQFSKQRHKQNIQVFEKLSLAEDWFSNSSS